MKESEQYSSWQDQLKLLLREFQANKRIVFHITDCLSADQIERFAFSEINSWATKHFEDEHLELKESLDQYSELFSYAILGVISKFVMEKMEPDVDEYVKKFEPIYNDFLEFVEYKQQKKDS